MVFLVSEEKAPLVCFLCSETFLLNPTSEQKCYCSIIHRTCVQMPMDTLAESCACTCTDLEMTLHCVSGSWKYSLPSGFQFKYTSCSLHCTFHHERAYFPSLEKFTHTCFCLFVGSVLCGFCVGFVWVCVLHRGCTYFHKCIGQKVFV